MMQAHQVFDVTEFVDGPDPGLNKTDRVLYHEGGRYSFVSPEEAIKEELIKAYFPSPLDAPQPVRLATMRDGSFSMRPVRTRRDVTKSYLQCKIL